MKFESVKCDECQRIQDGANHWMKMWVFSHDDGNTLAIGAFPHEVEVGGIQPDVHDLCGQRCAMLHIAKLLGWSAPTEGA
jgi:hypothetical protein